MTEDTETDDQPATHPGMETSMNEFSIFSPPVNGSEEAEQYQPSDDVFTEDTKVPSQPEGSKRKIGSRRSPLWQPALKGHEWIELRERQYQARNQEEKEGSIAETQITDELSVTWNHSLQSALPLNDFTHGNPPNPFRFNKVGPHKFLPGGLPDVDYPTNEDTTLQPNNQPVIMKGPTFVRQQSQQELVTRKDSDPVNPGKRRNSSVSLLGDTETSQQAWASKNLKSPSVQRRRPISTKPPPSQMSTQGWEQTLNNSSSNSSSNCNPKIKRNSLPTYMSYRSSSQRALKRHSQSSNPDMFGRDSLSHDPQAFSESELPDRKSKMRTHRSSSTSTVNTEGGARLRLPSRRLKTSSQAEGDYPSPLQGLLERAKDREKERGGLKKDKNVKKANLRSGRPPRPATPSPPCSDGDRDTEWEEVEVTRPRALTVSEGWKEQLVDGDEDEQGKRSVYDSDKSP